MKDLYVYYTWLTQKGIGIGQMGIENSSGGQWEVCAMILITTAEVGNTSSTFKSAELGGIRSARET
jgi:hypothetical protein